MWSKLLFLTGLAWLVFFYVYLDKAAAHELGRTAVDVRAEQMLAVHALYLATISFCWSRKTAERVVTIGSLYQAAIVLTWPTVGPPQAGLQIMVYSALGALVLHGEDLLSARRARHVAARRGPR